MEWRRNLWSDKSGPMIDFGERNNFQQQVNKVFNKLPVNIRICENKKSFIIEVSIRMKPWLGYCPDNSVLFFFSFGLFEIFV